MEFCFCLTLTLWQLAQSAIINYHFEKSRVDSGLQWQLQLRTLLQYYDIIWNLQHLLTTRISLLNGNYGNQFSIILWLRLTMHYCLIIKKEQFYYQICILEFTKFLIRFLLLKVMIKLLKPRTSILVIDILGHMLFTILEKYDKNQVRIWYSTISFSIESSG